MKIKTLNQETIDKIAAGEVIIRPASVVKELVENAIDAQAKKIEVEITEGGKRQILVRDNGIGIAYDEVSLAFKNHATSKLNEISDLDILTTMGFRGEALSSIVACADVLITTRSREEDLGSQSQFQNGKLKDQRIYPYEEGTEIIVSDLFSGIPARHKFLKKDETEEKSIRDIVQKLAISHPNISFSYVNDGHKVFQTTGNGNLEDVARNIFGNSFASHLHPFDIENTPMRVHGLLGDLDARRSHRANQIFFLNGRFVKNRLLSKAFEEEWAGKLMLHQYPSGIIFLDLPQRYLDINVHPQKTEVRILNQSLISLLFKQCLKKAIDTLNLIPEDFVEVETEVEEAKATINRPPDTEEKNETFKELFSVSQNSPKEENDQTFVPEILDQTISFREYQDEKIDEGIYNPRLDLINLKLIGQVFDTYIILQDEETLYIIDQHAAHEAILYEEFSQALRKGEGFESQGLLIPITVSASSNEIEDFKKVKDQLEAYGFKASVQDKSLQVQAVPMVADIIQPPELIVALIDWFSGLSEKAPDVGMKKIISISCKAAIKAGKHLDRSEIETLLSRLFKLDNPYTCPHGRPVIRKKTEYELEKLFKRVV